MTWSRIAGLRVPFRRRSAAVPGPRPLVLAGALLLAGLAGLVWIGITSSNPNVYIRAASGWLFFP